MNIFRFLGLLKLKSKVVLPLLGLFAIINGLWTSSLLLLINNKIAGTPLPFFDEYDWMLYLFLAITSFALSYYFKAYMIKMTVHFGNDLSLEVINKVRLSDYKSYLQLGEARIRTAMQDIGMMETLPGVFLSFFNAVVTIVVGIGYMFWVYPKGALVMVVLILVLGFIYAYRNAVIENFINEERTLDDDYMRFYNDFLYGFKKIKMGFNRSDSIFFDFIVKNREKAVGLNIKGELGVLGNSLIGENSFYVIIGTILFVLPVFFGVGPEVISSFLITILYIMGPITVFIGLMESFMRYNVAFRRINEFNEITSNNINHFDSITTDIVMPNLKSLTLQGLSYQYTNKNDEIIFELKPIDLKILKAEIIFISGGNGSGKSTFINMLSGLCAQQSGNLFFNDVLITDVNRSAYRNSISCIFADDYLFSENYDQFDLLPSNKQLADLLDNMALDGVIRHDIANNKIFHELSSGQQKRLALIYSILEDKDIFIFDEWAAEQDPEFRKYFYESIIPDLKRKGKTVIAITHDDGYYKFCDRMIRFNFGEMVEKEFSPVVEDFR